MLDWFKARALTVYSIGYGSVLLYRSIPEHRERLGKKMSELVGTVAKVGVGASCYPDPEGLVDQPDGASRPLHL